MKQATEYATEYATEDATEHTTRHATKHARQRARSSAAVGTPAGAKRRSPEIALVQIDATHDVLRGGRSVPRDDAWPWDRVTPSTPAEQPASEGRDDGWRVSDALYHEARRRRAVAVAHAIAWAIGAAGVLFRQALMRYRRWRETRATYETLAGLDDRTLRDMGFVRDEIRSVAAEATGGAERSRRIVVLADSEALASSDFVLNR